MSGNSPNPRKIPDARRFPHKRLGRPSKFGALWGIFCLSLPKMTEFYTVDAAKLGDGIYTLSDASRLLEIPSSKLRSWVSGYLRDDNRHYPAGGFKSRGEGRGKTFDFVTLIEVFVVAWLRELGVSMKTVRAARAELSQRFNTSSPFALEGILCDGKQVMKSLPKDCILELGRGGLLSFKSIIEPFCKRLDFDAVTHLAEKFYPDGRESSVVVDPRRSFGRPVIDNTNITTEMVACFIRSGDRIEEIAINYDLEPDQVKKAWEFEQRIAA